MVPEEFMAPLPCGKSLLGYELASTKVGGAAAGTLTRLAPAAAGVGEAVLTCTLAGAATTTDGPVGGADAAATLAGAGIAADRAGSGADAAADSAGAVITSECGGVAAASLAEAGVHDIVVGAATTSGEPKGEVGVAATLGEQQLNLMATMELIQRPL